MHLLFRWRPIRYTGAVSVRLFYVDESFDSGRFCLSAIAIRHTDWRECFAKVRQHRVILKRDHGIFLRKEIHAHEFVGGRGRISDRVVGKYERSRIFEGLLRLVAQLPNVMIINVCLDRAGRANVQLDAWDRLMNRIERTMLAMEDRELPLRRELISKLPADLPDGVRHPLEVRLNHYRPRAMIFADEGREIEITKALRKMSVFNPIPSKWGTWGHGERTKNIPVERVIEDPVFKKSHQSYFVQLADCVAFALLKREVAPTPHVSKYGINNMFERSLSGVCFRDASRFDHWESYENRRAARRRPKHGRLSAAEGRSTTQTNDESDGRESQMFSGERHPSKVSGSCGRTCRSGDPIRFKSTPLAPIQPPTISFSPSITRAISSSEARANFLPIRSTESVRTWLILIHDRFGRPVALVSQVSGNPARGSWLVMATAITVPDRSLKTSWLRIKTGRDPACS